VLSQKVLAAHLRQEAGEEETQLWAVHLLRAAHLAAAQLLAAQSEAAQPILVASLSC
jgi:hypothetical protein